MCGGSTLSFLCNLQIHERVVKEEEDSFNKKAIEIFDLTLVHKLLHLIKLKF